MSLLVLITSSVVEPIRLQLQLFDPPIFALKKVAANFTSDFSGTCFIQRKVFCFALQVIHLKGQNNNYRIVQNFVLFLQFLVFRNRTIMPKVRAGAASKALLFYKIFNKTINKIKTYEY